MKSFGDNFRGSPLNWTFGSLQSTVLGSFLRSRYGLGICFGDMLKFQAFCLGMPNMPEILG